MELGFYRFTHTFGDVGRDMFHGKKNRRTKSQMSNMTITFQLRLVLGALLLLLAHDKVHGQEVVMENGYFYVNDQSPEHDTIQTSASKRRDRSQPGQSPIIDPLVVPLDSMDVVANPVDCNSRTTEQRCVKLSDTYYSVDRDRRTTSIPAMDYSWFPQILPQGIIYHSYWAGIHEPRLGVQLISVDGGGSYWDPTMGARVGIFRYGNDDPLYPQGWQLDIEGAAMARLTLDDMRDLDTVDFRGGVPLTYGIDNWQFKLGYYHLSSHLGDEYAINNPGSLDNRVNYVRDSFMLGVSWYPVDFMRLYAEAAYAFNATDGAEPWEFQFGTELSRPGITGFEGSPFLAVNLHLREEHNFGGDFTAEAGWLWRGHTGHVLRVGAFYFNGKSSQYQFYDDSQQQIGVGMWYDF
ncbi:hypothetical protein V6x_42030 [Gimesia chilikensis]|uniref:DUF1207 domain-containing protein n=2 Tax=Gimesia chilikensis TaxID=2605989 RepID=A0A517WGU5_9PLAN|nr:hypothetical protein V6x_42030 [Gimesia chilikensis]